MIPGSLFVAGTDTGVGKTAVSAALTLGLNAAYWKPVQSGNIGPTDTQQVRAWTGLPAERFIPETYLLGAPMSPHASAELDGVAVEPGRILATPLPDDRPTVVEGAGGLLVPLNSDTLLIDLMVALALPVVLVARSGLGTLNHTLLSLSELRRRSLGVMGVVLVGDRHESNRAAIEHYGATAVIGEIPIFKVLDKTVLITSFDAMSLP